MRDLALGGLEGVGAVDEVLGEERAEVAADGAGGGLERVGGAHHRADGLPGVLGALETNISETGPAADELDELAVERLALVLGVVPAGRSRRR